VLVKHAGLPACLPPSRRTDSVTLLPLRAHPLGLGPTTSTPLTAYLASQPVWLALPCLALPCRRPQVCCCCCFYSASLSPGIIILLPSTLLLCVHTYHTHTRIRTPVPTTNDSPVCTHATRLNALSALLRLSPTKSRPSHSTAHTLHRPSARVNTAQSALQTTLLSTLPSRLPRPSTRLHFCPGHPAGLKLHQHQHHHLQPTEPTLRPTSLIPPSHPLHLRPPRPSCTLAARTVNPKPRRTDTSLPATRTPVSR